MSTIIVAHSIGATNDDNWYPALAADLRSEGHRVVVPQLPDPDAPQPDAWLKTLTEAAADSPATDTVLVGHSLGGVSILRLLERHDTGARGAFAGLLLVASMARSVGYEQLAGFFQPSFDWPVIKAAAGRARVLHAGDDPVTGAATGDHVMQFVTGLAATAIITPSGGHFPSTGEDCRSLPDAVDLIRGILEGRGQRQPAARGLGR